MIECLLVGLGGFLGSVLRYLIGLMYVNTDSGFPLKTFIINILGAFIIGALSSIAIKYNVNSKAILFLKVGLCGGFTTFSTFALETQELLKNDRVGVAIIYVTLSVVIGVTAVVLGENLFKNL
ncbi:MAG: fluoride efflux transporter CrcB [Peptostreptococcus porci]|uniref:Fluoride-specific ion channel FluC n=1 Tax=Peptostreptococcus porci TaxID=2652282 RepID=A0A6N7XH03_9FIRM|nr:fluoride efflux transporter CrcB [Peptostreptococcus porci]MDY5480074.1 fluoride efflux transporter CrcB [Peptostreptococcus porci]MST62489.1 fluoride efflux transporter CrcB [Peptostreptococcus porci]